MIAVPLTGDALQAAFQRIRDFSSVHTGEEYPTDAWRILQGSLGIDEDRIAQILEEGGELFNLTEEDDEHFFPGLMFGLMLGLIAADYAKETSES